MWGADTSSWVRGVGQQQGQAPKHNWPVLAREVHGEPAKGSAASNVSVSMCRVQAIPGAAAAVQHLRSCQVPYKFVTNTTTDKREGIAARLLRCVRP